MISSISSLPEDSSKSPSGDVYSVVLLSNKSCLSRRLVLSQPSRLVSSTSLPRVFHASFPCTFAWTQIEKQWSWMAQNVEKHLCIEQNTHFAAVCDCVISNLAAFWWPWRILWTIAWPYTAWIRMCCLFYSFHLFPVLQSSANCLISSFRVTWTSGARSGLSGRKGFLGASGGSLLWAASDIWEQWITLVHTSAILHANGSLKSRWINMTSPKPNIPTISQPYPNHIPTISQPYPNHIPTISQRSNRIQSNPIESNRNNVPRLGSEALMDQVTDPTEASPSFQHALK